jgi:hypothetical protein
MKETSKFGLLACPRKGYDEDRRIVLKRNILFSGLVCVPDGLSWVTAVSTQGDCRRYIAYLDYLLPLDGAEGTMENEVWGINGRAPRQASDGFS